MNGMMGGYAWLGMLVPLLLLSGLLALLAWAAVGTFSVRRSGGRAGPVEETLRERFARGEVNAEEYERSLEVLKSNSDAARSGGARTKLLVAGLATAALLAVGGGVALAGSQMGSTMMSGSGMGPMMGNGQMDSMMSGEGMGEGQMMGSFDEEKPFDLQFIDQMTMHHEGAIMSSEHMIGDSERPELRQLAENIQKSQSEQIEQMQAWREQWYGDAEQTSEMPVGMMGEMMGDGMMDEMMGGSMQDMMGGDATDAMFLRMMIPHHQMAIDMSEEALDGKAEHSELKELAQTVRDEQSAEIELMQGYLDEIERTTDS